LSATVTTFGTEFQVVGAMPDGLDHWMAQYRLVIVANSAKMCDSEGNSNR